MEDFDLVEQVVGLLQCVWIVCFAYVSAVSLRQLEVSERHGGVVWTLVNLSL
jgi:hypothetical protein